MSLVKYRNMFGVLVVALVLMLSSACDTANTAAALNALDMLVQNKDIAQQGVRDVKRSVDPNDPVYIKTMYKYDDARDIYNHLLDVLESAARDGRTPSQLAPLVNEMREASSAFLSTAAQAVQPSIDVRSLDLDRAIQVPPHCTRSMRQVPSKLRDSVIQEIDKQVRWKSWREL